MEEVDYDGPIVGNGAYNTAGVVKNHFQDIKKSEVETDLNATENIVSLRGQLHRTFGTLLIPF